MFVIFAGQLRMPGEHFEIRPTERSNPAEATLRTLRLAGVEQATVALAAGGDMAMVRLAVPGFDTAADAQIAWQAAVTALAASFPESERYVVQLAHQEAPILEIEWPAEAVRAAIDADDAVGLAEDARFWFLPAEAGGEGTPGTRMPIPSMSIDAEAPGHYLDEKNRAFGLAADAADGAAELAQSASAMRAAAPGIPALPAGSDAGRYWASIATAALHRVGEPTTAARVEAESVLSELEGAPAGLQPAEVARVRAIALAAIAIDDGSLGSVLAASHALAERVGASRPITRGDLAAVREAFEAATADAVGADRPARAVAGFERAEELDLAPSAVQCGSDSVVELALAEHAQVGLPIIAQGRRETLAPERWLAYRRADGVLFWLAGDGGTRAITDASLRGWGWSRTRVAVVDAARPGRVLAHVEVR